MIFWNLAQAHKKFEKISSTCFKIENNDGTFEEHPQFKDARFDAIQKAVQAYDNNPASGPNKTSLGLVTTILDVNLNNTNPLTVKAKKILPSVARTVSFFQNHEDFFAEYYSQLSKRLIKANGASQQELTVMNIVPKRFLGNF